VFQLPAIFSRIEMALRRSDLSVPSEGPSLEAADEDPTPRPSWPGAGSGKRPVVLRRSRLDPDVCHDDAEVEERNDEGSCHRGDGVPPDGRRAIIDPERALRRAEFGDILGFLAALARGVVRREVPQVRGVR